MGITLHPQELSKSNQAYINAGITFNGGYNGTTTGIGAVSVTPPTAVVSGSTGPGTGYLFYYAQRSTQAINFSNAFNASYGNVFYAEVSNPFSTVSTTASTGITITTTQDTASGSTAIQVSTALSSVVSGALLVSGPGIANATTVSSISGTTLNISAATTSIIPNGTTITLTPSGGSWPTGSSFIGLSSVANLKVGAILTHASIPTNTYVTAIAGNAVQLSAVTTGAIAPAAAVTSTPAITFANVLWHNNAAPTQASNGRSVYLFYTPDNGTTLYGRQIMANLAGANAN